MEQTKTPKEFIEKAIEGGWKPYGISCGRYKIEKVHKYQGIDGKQKYSLIFDIEERDEGGGQRFRQALLDEILLDPLAWQAFSESLGSNYAYCKECGSSRQGWPSVCTKNDCGGEYTVEWLDRMHRMVDALAEGKTIEEFLSTLIK